MALIDFMSFDTLNTTAGYPPAGWTWDASQLSRESGDKKTGTYSARADGSTDASLRALSAAEEHGTLIVGMWVNVDDFGYYNALARLGGDAAATQHITYVLETDGTLKARLGGHGGTVLASGTSGIVKGTWRHVEFKTVLSDTVGSVACRIDGVQLFNVTGIDTKNGGTDTVFDTVWLPYTGNSFQALSVDDWFLLNGDSGATPYDWIGAARVYSSGPDGNGNSSGFTGSDGNSTDNYLLVDESDFSAGSDYVGAAADSLLDLYTMGDVTLPTGAEPLGVKVSALALNSSSGARTIKMAVRSGTTNSVGAAQTLNTSMRTYERLMVLNPVTSAAWTGSDVNGLQVGYESGS